MIFVICRNTLEVFSFLKWLYFTRKLKIFFFEITVLRTNENLKKIVDKNSGKMRLKCV